MFKSKLHKRGLSGQAITADPRAWDIDNLRMWAPNYNKRYKLIGLVTLLAVVYFEATRKSQEVHYS